MEPKQLEDLLRSLGADRTQIVGNKVTACCPVHGESNPSFCAWTEGSYNCFACGSHGTLAKLVKEVHGCGWQDAAKYVRRFGEYDGGVFKKGEIPEYSKRFRDKGLAIVPQEILDGFSTANYRMLHYLSLRGVQRKVVERAGLRRFAEDSRIIFPWYDGDVPRGMTSRSYVLEDDPHRGMALLGFDKKNYLYHACGAHQRHVKLLVVCEGEISALRLRSQGYFACALGGWQMSPEQAKKLASMADKALLMFDNDSGGIRGEALAASLLGPLMPTFKPVDVPAGYVDPADCSPDVLARVVNGSMTLC